jgi:hypothetical protein
MTHASLAQGEHPPAQAVREGAGSIPACGSKSETWPVVGGLFESRTVVYDHCRVYGVIQCPRCGCSKRPHVVYSARSHHMERLKRGCWASCNYCKVRWVVR